MRQTQIDTTTYVICGVILLCLTYIGAKIIFKVSQKSFLLILTLITSLGCVGGILTAYLVQNLFNIGNQSYEKVVRDRHQLEKITTEASYTIAVFFCCFNTAHWLFAMKYWSVALKLQSIVEEWPTDKQYLINSVGVVGLLLNIGSGVLIVLAFYNFGNQTWGFWTELGNILPNCVSLLVMIDALRRFRNVAKGVF